MLRPTIISTSCATARLLTGAGPPPPGLPAPKTRRPVRRLAPARARAERDPGAVAVLLSAVGMVGVINSVLLGTQAQKHGQSPIWTACSSGRT